MRVTFSHAYLVTFRAEAYLSMTEPLRAEDLVHVWHDNGVLFEHGV